MNIFESLNSTGLSLTQGDLIRNYLLMNHEYEKQKMLYKNFWLEIEKEIANPGFLHRELSRIDPEEAQKLHPHSLRYLIRALEIYYST